MGPRSEFSDPVHILCVHDGFGGGFNNRQFKRTRNSTPERGRNPRDCYRTDCRRDRRRADVVSVLHGGPDQAKMHPARFYL